jgi:hypothetical protein
MRVKDWGFSEIDGLVADASDAKLVEAAEVLAKEVRRLCPVGTITHPIYRRGKFANQKWTSRDAGRLKKSIRVTRKREPGRLLFKKRDVRVYAGHYMAWYASVVEFYTPFVRPGITAAMPEMRRILSGKS